AEEHEHLRRGGGRDCGRPPPVPEQSQLAEEVSGAERPNLVSVDRDRRGSVLEDEERVPRRALTGEVDAGADALELEPRRDRRAVYWRECLEQRDAGEILCGRGGHRG